MFGRSCYAEFFSDTSVERDKPRALYLLHQRDRQRPCLSERAIRGSHSRAEYFPEFRIERAVTIDEATGVWLVSKLIELHADLLAGPSGRKVNGIGALAVLLSVITGLLIWWPGIKNWRRSLILRRGGGWRVFNWDLHGVIGFWGFGFSVVFAVSGLYLCFPEGFHALADRLDPPADGSFGVRFVDKLLSWLAYSHFGRINGIGIPCSGPGSVIKRLRQFGRFSAWLLRPCL